MGKKFKFWQLLLASISIFCFSQVMAAGASYVHIFNADTAPINIKGYSGYHANWLNGRKDGDLKPYGFGSFDVSQAITSTLSQRFIINYTSSGVEKKQYFIFGTASLPECAPEKVNYATLIPLDGDEGRVAYFYTKVSNKEMKGVKKTGSCTKNKNVIDGFTQLNTHPTTPFKQDKILYPVFGINSDGLSGIKNGGSTTASVAVYIYGNAARNGGVLIKQFYSGFLSNYEGNKADLKQAAKIWMSEQEFGEWKVKAINWYIDIISEDIPTEISKQIKHNRKASKWDGIFYTGLSAFSVFASHATQFKYSFKNTDYLMKSLTIWSEGDIKEPAGSYKDSCTNIRYSNSDFELKASCKNKSGDNIDSTLFYLKCLPDEYNFLVENNNGSLSCSKAI